jgi:hypothetical protein
MRGVLAAFASFASLACRVCGCTFGSGTAKASVLFITSFFLMMLPIRAE